MLSIFDKKCPNFVSCTLVLVVDIDNILLALLAEPTLKYSHRLLFLLGWDKKLDQNSSIRNFHVLVFKLRHSPISLISVSD